jgi:hypothetical protein
MDERATVEIQFERNNKTGEHHYILNIGGIVKLFTTFAGYERYLKKLGYTTPYENDYSVYVKTYYSADEQKYSKLYKHLFIV